MVSKKPTTAKAKSANSKPTTGKSTAAKVKAKPAAKPPKTSTKSPAKARAKPIAKAKPAAKPAKTPAKSTAKAGAKATAKAGTKANAKAGTKATTKAKPKAAPKTASKAQSKTTPRKTPKSATGKKSASTRASAQQTSTKTSAKAATPVAPKPAAKQPAAPIVTDKKSAHGFKIGEHIVYPAHGVGLIREISLNEVAGMTLELFVIDFDKEKMVLRVPLEKAKTSGMRKLADKAMLEASIKTLKGRARVKRTMWSRRAQEYEAKINSGDLVAIAEVVRDLFRNENQPEQSYSERQLYEAALERMAREYGTIQKITDDEAIIELEQILAKTTGGAPKTTSGSA